MFCFCLSGTGRKTFFFCFIFFPTLSLFWLPKIRHSISHILHLFFVWPQNKEKGSRVTLPNHRIDGWMDESVTNLSQFKTKVQCSSKPARDGVKIQTENNNKSFFYFIFFYFFGVHSTSASAFYIVVLSIFLSRISNYPCAGLYDSLVLEIKSLSSITFTTITTTTTITITIT